MVEGRAICSISANEFYAFLKDSKERRTRRALKTECFKSGPAVSHRQHHIINTHSACECYSNRKSSSKGLGTYSSEWTQHQPTLFARSVNRSVWGCTYRVFVAKQHKPWQGHACRNSCKFVMCRTKGHATENALFVKERWQSCHLQ